MSAFDYGIVVPVRGGSIRIRQKNLLPFGTQNSLLEWKIAQLAQLFPKDRIYVSTEDQSYKELARAANVQVLDREERLARGNDVSLHDVIAGVIRDIPHEHIAWCQVTSPLMSPAEYAACFRSYETQVLQGTHDSLVGVNLLKEYLWDASSPINYLKDFKHTPTQELADIYRLTNSIFMAPKERMLHYRYYIGPNPFKQVLSKLAGIDIDEMEDYDMACALYALYASKQ